MQGFLPLDQCTEESLRTQILPHISHIKSTNTLLEETNPLISAFIQAHKNALRSTYRQIKMSRTIQESAVCITYATADIIVSSTNKSGDWLSLVRVFTTHNGWQKLRHTLDEAKLLLRLILEKIRGHDIKCCHCTGEGTCNELLDTVITLNELMNAI